MTELKDVIHLYLGCECLVQFLEDKEGIRCRIESISDDYVTFTKNAPDYYFSEPECGFTPILSRLSDMTEEDAIEVAAILGGSDHLARESKIHQIKELIEGIYHNQTNIPGIRWMRFTTYLLSKGYWLFGDEAFDKGLIIDKKTLKV